MSVSVTSWRPLTLLALLKRDSSTAFFSNFFRGFATNQLVWDSSVKSFKQHCKKFGKLIEKYKGTYKLQVEGKAV